MPDPSSTPSTTKPSPTKTPTSSPKNRRWNIGATVAVVIGIVAALYVANRPSPVDDELQWYATVHEVVGAAGMLFEVTWARGTSADARASIGQRAEKALESAAAGARSEEAMVAAGQVSMEATDSRQTTWRVEMPVVLGYRTRPMEPQLPVAALGTPGGTGMAAGLAVALLAAGEEDPRQAFAADSEDFVGRLAIRVQTEEGRWERVGTEHEFQTGDRFRFEAESSRPARLFVFHQPPGGERAELWPGGRDDPNRVERGRPVTVPAPPAAFEMQDDTGLETFFIALADVEAVERERLEGAALGNYVLRGLGEAGTRGVGIVDDAEPWLYFRPGEASGYLAAVGFQLRHGSSG